MATDDRWDDEPERPRRDRAAERARSKVLPPAIGLIIVGVFSLAAALLGAIQYGSLPQQFQQQMQQFDEDPKMNDEQRAQVKEMFRTYEKVLMTALPISWVFNAITGLILLAAGVKMMSLSGRGLGILASILAMIPCVSGCCLIGIPVGIWALVVLNAPDVRAAFARSARGRDEFDDRGGDGEPL